MSDELELKVQYGSLPPWPNSAIFYAGDKALLVDTQFMKDDARDLIERIKSDGKELETVLITHSHPDHVWGGVELKKAFPNVRFLARPVIAKEIECEFRARLLRWTGVFNAEPFGDQIPQALYEIEHLEGDTFDFHGHTIEVLDLSPAETIHATAYYVPSLKCYVAGDQVYNRCHYYIGAGLNRPDLWEISIREVYDKYEIDILVPGHGRVGGTEIFDEAIEYLRTYAEVAKPLVSQEVVVDRMTEAYPDWKMEGVLYMTIGPSMTSPALIARTGGHMGFGDEKVVEDA